MAFPTIGTTEWNDLATAYLYDFTSKMPKDQWSKQYPALQWLLNNKVVRPTAAKMAWPIEDTTSTLGASYTGWQGVTPTDRHTATMAEQAMAHYAEPIMIAETDESTTDGGLFDLLEFKTKAARKALTKEHSRQLWAASLGTATDFQSIPLAIPVDPTADVAFNNVSGASGKVTSWRNKTQTSTGSWSANGIDKLDALLNEMAEEKTPDILITTRTVFGFMQKNGRGYLQGNMQTNSKAGKQMLDLGIPVLFHNGIPIVHDPDCTAGCIYAFSEGAIEWRVYSKQDYKIKEPGFQSTQINGKFGSLAYLGLSGNLCVTERRALGRVDTINAA
jgi:hypothetical protein